MPEDTSVGLTTANRITASAKTRSWSEAEKAKRARRGRVGKCRRSESIQIEATHASRWPR